MNTTHGNGDDQGGLHEYLAHIGQATELRSGARLIERLAGHREEWLRRQRVIEDVIRRGALPTMQEVRLASVPLGAAWKIVHDAARVANPTSDDVHVRFKCMQLMCWFLGEPDDAFWNGFAGGNTISGASWFTVWAMRAEWASLAFPTIQLSADVASSLIATNHPTDGECHSPWPSFAIELPGQEPWSGYCVWLQHAVTVERGELFTVMTELDKGGAGHLSASFHRTLGELGKLDISACDVAPVQDTLSARGYSANEDEFRLSSLVAKLASSVVVALSSDAATTKRTDGKRVHVLSLPSAPGTYALGLPIKCDLTHEVAAWVRGETKSITRSAVRWLVRGHWRMQVCGKEQAARRRTWIAPYWKGPERAAALVRPHVITDRDA